MDPSPITNAAVATQAGVITAAASTSTTTTEQHKHHHHHHHHEFVDLLPPPGNFIQKVLNRQYGIVTFGLTPPRVTVEDDKVQALVANTIERLKAMPIDSAIIYDIHDESDRNTGGVERPFPYVETVDGEKFMSAIMPNLPESVSCCYYRCIVKHTMDQLTDFVQRNKNQPRASCVFVGAASSNNPNDAPPPPLGEVYKMHQNQTVGAAAGEKADESKLPMGAVAIPERHASKNNEHERMISKQKAGCKFFVTQVVFSAELCKNMISDYMVACKEQNLPILPIILTFAPIGSLRTFEFMKWLGVEPSKWFSNDLKLAYAENKNNDNNKSANDAVLEESIDAIVRQMRDIVHWAKSKNIPVGMNIESVAIRKAEIDAAVELVSTARKILASA
jgi:hypothetical protein